MDRARQAKHAPSWASASGASVAHYDSPTGGWRLDGIPTIPMRLGTTVVLGACSRSRRYGSHSCGNSSIGAGAGVGEE